jgi:hypothetical protein
MANGSEEILFYKLFILGACLGVQLSENVTFPRAIPIYPNIFQHNGRTFVDTIFIYFDGFEYPGASPSKRFGAVRR